MEEDGEDLTPFWVQCTGNRRPGRRFHRGLPSFFLSSGLLIFILLVTAVSFLVFVVPTTISFSSQIFRPNNVKKSWDSLNLVLVLLALVFGFLSRNKNEDRNFDEYSHQTTSHSHSTRNETQKTNPSIPQGWYNYSSTEVEKSNPSNHLQWFGYSDQTGYNASNNTGARLMRTSSSYPDLLEASLTLTSENDSWVCYDDMLINTSRFSDAGHLHLRRSWKYTIDDPQHESKKLYEDTFMISPKQPLSTPPAPPSPPPAPPSPPSPPPVSPPLPPASPPLDHEKPERAYQSVGHKRERRRKRKDNQLERKEPISKPAKTPPPPPPPPPPPFPESVDQKSGKIDKKRSGGNATKDFLNSLYHKKKKKQRQKSVENFDAFLHEPQIPPLHLQLPPPSPPPPPPPPPPPSVFQNLFSSKKSKGRTTGTVIYVPIPPPETAVAAVSSRPKASPIVTVAAHKPLQQVKVRSFDTEEGNSNSGGESPVIPIPPPPPPPPPFLKSPAWKFVLQGDFVRLDSNVSSRSGSPEPDDVESNGTPTPTAADGGDVLLFSASPLFCPSPDVNTKADNFISKFRAGLKLEKINSMNKRGVGLSNLGTVSGPTS